MQSGQVSVWVPIVVGIIGLIGVIVAQLINARRERRREDTRWRRELERERSAREHETQTYWRDRRIEVYSDTLSLLYQWLETILLAAQQIIAGGEVSSEYRERLKALQLDSNKIAGRVELLGSEEFITKVVEAIELNKSDTRQLMSGRLSPAPDDEDDIEAFYAATADRFYEARASARKELLISEEGGR